MDSSSRKQRDPKPRLYKGDALTIDFDSIGRHNLLWLRNDQQIMISHTLPGHVTLDVSCTVFHDDWPKGAVFIDWPPDPDQPIHGARFTWTRSRGDGRRWMFGCLHPTDSGFCGRSCRILYRRLDGGLYGCRHCIGIRYQPFRDRLGTGARIDLERVADRKRRVSAAWDNSSQRVQKRILECLAEEYYEFLAKYSTPEDAFLKGFQRHF